MLQKIATPFFLFACLFTFPINLSAQPSCLGTQGQLKWFFWENIRNDELDELTHLPSFPYNPDAQENITELKSIGSVSEVTEEGNIYESVQYGTYYGSMVRGYLTVAESGSYTFNLTGDDEVKFWLSTDDTKENLQLNTNIATWSYRKEFDKPKITEEEQLNNQTSTAINLVTGNYYYFEIWHKEHSGGDHFEVLWKTPSNTTEWQDIPSNQLYDFACSLDCPPKGNSCDDGNANTVNDKADGFCNCIGEPINLPSCVGTRGEIKSLYFLDLLGSSSMSTFLEAEKYPLMPDTVEILDRFQGPQIFRDYYGTKIAGYLTVPVTGDYQFSVTCDDRASFALSTDESPNNLVELSFSNWSREFDHYDEVTQIQAPVTLTKDNFYYFEVHHREGGGGDRFSVFWRTPFSQDTLWRYMDDTYVYGYACEMACIPEGTPCDDNNNFTKNDRYDADCNCVGEPCRGAECEETPPLTYTPTSECGISEKLDNSAADAWESCTPSANPNAGRGVSHWIQYDLGQDYLLNGTHIWNYNVEGATGQGFKEVVIDYSSDGITWTQLGGIFEWSQATGTVGYEGFEGPNFNGVTARYILITALNSWDNGMCSGFSKITIEATDCLLMGQTCDDGDPNSVNDLYDENCNCIGEGEGFNPCGPENLIQEDIMLTKSEYRATTKIETKARIDMGVNVNLIAGESVTLKEGFHAMAGSTLFATIENCEAAMNVYDPIVENNRVTNIDNLLSEENNLEESELILLENIKDGATTLSVMPNPTKSWTSFLFNLPTSTTASLCIYATDGRQIICLANRNNFAEGAYKKEFPAQRLSAGMYYIVLKTEQVLLTKPFVVIE